MSVELRRLIAWPSPAVVFSLLALIIVIRACFDDPSILFIGTDSLLLIIFLCATVVGAGLYPIHIRHNMKIVLTTIPLYTAALLVPPLFAALLAGIGMLVIEQLTRPQTGNTASDTATAVSRWVIIAYFCSWVGQQILHQHLPIPLLLLSVAVLMFTCDILTVVFEIAPMSGEAPLRILKVLVREAGVSEAVQYLIGMLAVLAAFQQTWSLLLWIVPISIVYRSFRYAKEMHEGTARLLEGLADAVDLRDPYTGGHSRRVTEYSIQILRALNVTGPEVELIRSAARVHDIGKIGIPDQILNKAGRLTDEEKRIMDSHPDRGADLLARYRDFAHGTEIVRHHHEQWDGQGYPAGLKGADIPFGARVVAVADSYDAMTSDRPYRAGMPTHVAMRILHEGRGQQWDPAVVDAFLNLLTDTSPQPTVDLAVPSSNIRSA